MGFHVGDGWMRFREGLEGWDRWMGSQIGDDWMGFQNGIWDGMEVWDGEVWGLT